MNCSQMLRGAFTEKLTLTSVTCKLATVEYRGQKRLFPFILFSYQSFSLSYLELQTIFPCSDIGPATATLDPRPRHWTRDLAIGPRPRHWTRDLAIGPRSRHWTPDRDIGQISDTKITSSYTALSHNFPTNKKSKVSSSNKCNKIFGQSRRENF